MCAAWRRSTLHRKRHLERVGIVHVQAQVNVAMIDLRRRGSTLQGDEVDALLYCPNIDGSIRGDAFFLCEPCTDQLDQT